MKQFWQFLFIVFTCAYYDENSYGSTHSTFIMIFLVKQNKTSMMNDLVGCDYSIGYLGKKTYPHYPQEGSLLC